MQHIELLTKAAQRFTEETDEHTRLELLLEVRAATGAQTELEVIALLFQALHLEHKRADEENLRGEYWLCMYRDAVKPPNWRGDKRHLLTK